MTDDTIRPGSEPSREPEPTNPEEPVVDDAADVAEGPGPTAEVEGQEPGIDAPEIEVAEPAEEDVPVAGQDAAAESIEEATDAAAEPVVEEVADIPDDVPEAAPDETTESEAEAAVESVTVNDEEQAAETTEDEAAPPASEVAEAAESESADTSESAPVAAETEADGDTAQVAARDDVFVWHPDHQGKSFDEVRATLAQDIAADQRQHRLAMDGAEESEQEALASVVTLERRWGPYDFDWAEQEPEELADRIVEFEQERERRQELITWNEYRNATPQADDAQAIGERTPELSTSAKGLSLLLVVLLIVVILLAVWAL